MSNWARQLVQVALRTAFVKNSARTDSCRETAHAAIPDRTSHPAERSSCLSHTNINRFAAFRRGHGCFVTIDFACVSHAHDSRLSKDSPISCLWVARQEAGLCDPYAVGDDDDLGELVHNTMPASQDPNNASGYQHGDDKGQSTFCAMICHERRAWSRAWGGECREDGPSGRRHGGFALATSVPHGAHRDLGRQRQGGRR